MNQITIKLNEYQKKIIDYALKNSESIDRYYLFHSTGSGKTITSIILAYLLLITSKSVKKIIISAPVSIVNNFYKEINKLKLNSDLFDIMTYHSLINNIKNDIYFLKNKIVIIDEFHNFRSSTPSNTILIKGINNAKYAILLSATPIVNNKFDFALALAVLNKTTYSKAFDMIDNPKYIKKKLSYYKFSGDSLKQHFPNTQTETVYLHMSQEYFKEYYAVEQVELSKLPENFKNKDITRFLNGVRRASNNIFSPSPKIEWIVNKIKDYPSKTIVYSFWKNSGIYIIAHLLDKLKIKYGIIEGSLSIKERNDIVNKYNSNEIKVLLFSSAGAEGLDLKETRRVIILEPHWNNEKLKQVVGRAVRFNSHTGLRESKRLVKIYNLILKKPEKRFFSYLNPFRYFEKSSIDEWMANFAKEKEKLNDEYIKYMIKYSI